MSQFRCVEGVIGFGAFQVDLYSGESRKNGTGIKLQVRPFEVLQILLEQAGQDGRLTVLKCRLSKVTSNSIDEPSSVGADLTYTRS